MYALREVVRLQTPPCIARSESRRTVRALRSLPSLAFPCLPLPSPHAQRRKRLTTYAAASPRTVEIGPSTSERRRRGWVTHSWDAVSRYRPRMIRRCPFSFVPPDSPLLERDGHPPPQTANVESWSLQCNPMQWQGSRVPGRPTHLPSHDRSSPPPRPDKHSTHPLRPPLWFGRGSATGACREPSDSVLMYVYRVATSNSIPSSVQRFRRAHPPAIAAAQPRGEGGWWLVAVECENGRSGTCLLRYALKRVQSQTQINHPIHPSIGERQIHMSDPTFAFGIWGTGPEEGMRPPRKTASGRNESLSRVA
jgi:hypothetical protein